MGLRLLTTSLLAVALFSTSLSSLAAPARVVAASATTSSSSSSASSSSSSSSSASSSSSSSSSFSPPASPAVFLRSPAPDTALPLAGSLPPAFADTSIPTVTDTSSSASPPSSSSLEAVSVELDVSDIGDPLSSPSGFAPAATPSGTAPAFSTASSLLLRPFANDPLGVVAHYNLIHVPSKWKVFSCDWGKGGHDPAAAVAYFQPRVNQWFSWMSAGAYTPLLEVGGSVSAASREDCPAAARAQLSSTERNQGVAVVTLTWYALTRGYGSPKAFRIKGDTDETRFAEFNTTTPYVRLEAARMDIEAAAAVLIHEMGHAVGWHHMPYHHLPDLPYSFPNDIMSNGSHLVPTHAFNRYRLGWLAPSQAVFHTSSTQTVNLSVPGKPGPQLLLLADPQTPGRFFAVGANPGQEFPSISGLSSKAGVDVLVVDQSLDSPHAEVRISHCPTLSFGAGMCARLGVYTAALAPSSVRDRQAFALDAGQSMSVGGVTVSVSRRTADGFELKLSGSPQRWWGRSWEHPIPAGQFKDVPKQHLFHTDINKLFSSGITKGCNPPANDLYCPDASVTRGQMAAFLTRALNLPSGSKVFSDTDGHLFGSEIAALERAGITRGCNPPTNTRFCPDQPVTRGEMAAFMTRALKLPAGSKVFSDTRGHRFQADVAALERAGITKGCNPPDNSRFCPNDPVTRAQMAAFLNRAGLTD